MTPTVKQLTISTTTINCSAHLKRKLSSPILCQITDVQLIWLVEIIQRTTTSKPNVNTQTPQDDQSYCTTVVYFAKHTIKAIWQQVCSPGDNQIPHGSTSQSDVTTLWTAYSLRLRLTVEYNILDSEYIKLVLLWNNDELQ